MRSAKTLSVTRWSPVRFLRARGARISSPATSVTWVVFNELHVQNVAVHPQHRGRGLGRFLVEEALELGRAARCLGAFLEVRESNTNARQLYVSMGFREVGKRKRYYSRPRQHAIQYRKEAPLINNQSD